MADLNLLKSEIVKKGYTQRAFCEKIGMPQSTFSRRMKSGIFKTDEAAKIIEVLELENPGEIFFVKQLT